MMLLAMRLTPSSILIDSWRTFCARHDVNPISSCKAVHMAGLILFELRARDIDIDDHPLIDLIARVLSSMREGYS